MSYHRLDSSSEKIHIHLMEALQKEAIIDAKLVGTYILQLRNNPSIMFPDEEYRQDVTQNKYINTFIPTINEILNSSDYYRTDPDNEIVNLLDCILSYLTIDEILQLYPLEFILNGLHGSSAICCMVVKLLRRNANSATTIKLFEETEILKTIVTRHFEKDTSLEIANQVELLVGKLVTISSPVVSSQLLNPKFRDLYDELRGDGSKLVKFLDYILLMMPFILSKQHNFPEKYYVLSKHQFSDNDDVLQIVLYVQFYGKLVQELNRFGHDSTIFENVKPCLRDLIALFQTRQNDSTVESFYSIEIVDLLIHLSHSTVNQIINFNNEIIEEFKMFKSYNIFLNLDCDIKLLSAYNPRYFQVELVKEILDDVPIFSKKYFTILLNAIGSSVLFEELVPHLTTSKISGLSLDLLYKLLLQISRFEYSTKYLLNSLPNIVSNYLIDPTVITESDIWSLRKETLHNLLTNNTDLDVWYDNIYKNYNIMCYGRNVRDVLPRVDVIDKSLQ